MNAEPAPKRSERSRHDLSFSIQKKTEENMYIGLGGLLILILILWLLGVI
jgi:hypothetical protein